MATGFYPPSIDLRGRRALVTGASSGIGAGIAMGLASCGASVAINFRHNQRAAEKMVKQCQRAGIKAVAVGGDASQAKEAGRIVRLAATMLGGPVNVLVTNFGPFAFGPLQSLSPAEFEKIVRENLFSTQAFIHAVLPNMVKARSGTVITVGLSCAADSIDAAPNVAAYALSKAAIASLTRSLAAELAPHGVRVASVAPGLIATENQSPTQQAWMQRRVPSGRLGTPQEVANVVAFLCSDLATYCSGSIISVAGGWRWDQDRTTRFDSSDVTDQFSRKPRR